ncbi:MAG TPA: FAD-dependent monooxygenase [Candidatus Baltobacteraceae bacterium]|jgi:2-polyprenyl-6-methoxyphenol hydroxylase-like FAD-dependent oxidoreductase|nr:FAD-dependent monooxygenase [Candidatus Baltobacteraceae bacterium]
MTANPVLIAGAGPTGLVLALSLARRGVPLRIVDAAAGPGEHSRAMAVQARTLEFYRQFGFAGEMVAQGIVMHGVHMRELGRDGRLHEVTSVVFGDLGGVISPYPFALAYPQDDHERFLTAKLAAIGCFVEWNTSLTGFEEDDDGVTATLRGPAGEESLLAAYVCGCDGAHSAVRHALDLGFAGGTYDQIFFVADVKIAAATGNDLYATLGERSLLLRFPVRSSGMQRLIGLVPPELTEEKDLDFEMLRESVEQLLGTPVTEVNWFSRYRVHHRVAEAFRRGRGFILGDAAHIHSPAGGQGMNTGIGDAINLGWKLAGVLGGRLAPAVLDTYEEERIGFARALVATTDRAFTPVVAGGFKGEVTRKFVMPLFLTLATRLDFTKHAFFRLISQVQIHYADSALSKGKAGHTEGGDRLPWCAPIDNFKPLQSLDWQLHVFEDVDEDVGELCSRYKIPVHQFLWSEAVRNAGFARDAAYLVRPDGYVGLAIDGDEAKLLEAYLSRHFTPGA